MNNVQAPRWKDAPRYIRNQETGHYRRAAYRHHGRRSWIGGRGYVYTDVVTIWNPERGTLEEAGEAAAPGERFALVLTEEEFARLTFPPEDLPPVGRETARRIIEQAARERPGETLACRFVKRTNGELRAMRFRYDPAQDRRGLYGFDPKAKGLMPVYDVEKEARRFINLDGVRDVAGHHPAAS